MHASDRQQAFVQRMWNWFGSHKRELPWRDLTIKNESERAYRILVSEVMLQQTQVPRVIVIYKRFLEQFPKLQDLARASNKEVIVAWRGMGYNSRALRLRDAAREIMKGNEGNEGRKAAGQNVKFPKEMNQLLAIKGIGAYTAAAIRNFAFNIPTPCIDTNIRRVMHRVFIGPERSDGTFTHDDKKIMPIVETTLRIAMETKNHKPFTKNPSSWHAALMDFGSLVCTKRSPKCDVCPIAKNGVCKSAFRIGGRVARSGPVETPYYGVSTTRRVPRREPGRIIAGTFVPNRIIRGRVIESLRDASKGMTFDAIGKSVAIDWSFDDHGGWFKSILEKLERDQLVSKKSSRYFLTD